MGRLGMAVKANKQSGATLGGRLRHELIQYGLISAYLYVCFAALILYKAAILRGQGISYAPYGLAAVKALVLAKFMLLGHAAGIGDRYASRRLAYVILRKAALFLLLLLVLSAAEELIVGSLHGRSIGASLADIGGGTLWQLLAVSLIMLLILVPYVAYREISAALGRGGLSQLLLRRGDGSGPRRGPPASQV
jgi:hypothetical protein